MPTAIDFGTTNSSLVVKREGKTSLATYSLFQKPVSTFRSALFIFQDEYGERRIEAGTKALEAFSEQRGEGRLIKSLKNFLTDGSFTSTMIHGRSYRLAELIAFLLRPLVEGARSQFGDLPEPFIVGRPVRFVGQRTSEDEEMALSRLQDAYSLVGIKNVTFEMEPVAAAATYSHRINKEEVVLVVDGGGGTTDFCITKLNPSCRGECAEVLSTTGIGLAGDAFDGCLVDQLISPYLGLYDEIVPRWVPLRFKQLSLYPSLRMPENLKIIRDVAFTPNAPPPLKSFVTLLKENLGYEVFHEVSEAKARLSSNETTSIDYEEFDLSLHLTARRDEFEEGLRDTLDRIEGVLSEGLKLASLKEARIQRVFLTGGTSLVPAFRRCFEQRFGAEKIATGEEFTSVATGLAQLM
jgi:hypothetical chaperone protein